MPKDRSTGAPEGRDPDISAARLAQLKEAKSNGMIDLYALWRRARAASAMPTSTDEDDCFLVRVGMAIEREPEKDIFDTAAKLSELVHAMGIQFDRQQPEWCAAAQAMADKLTAVALQVRAGMLLPG